jgi:hypothetical protein
MGKKKIVGFFMLIIIVIAGVYVFKLNPDARGYINKIINKFEGKTLNEKFETKIKSGNLFTDYNIDQALRDVNKFQLNTLNYKRAILHPINYQQ